MVQTYNILGKQVASHYLAMGILGTLFGGVYASLGGSKATPATPPINASSPDEADFIKKFMDQAEADQKKQGSTTH